MSTVDLQIWPEMIHIWHIFFPMLSAGRRAIAAGGSFVRNAIAGRSRTDGCSF